MRRAITALATAGLMLAGIAGTAQAASPQVKGERICRYFPYDGTFRHARRTEDTWENLAAGQRKRLRIDADNLSGFIDRHPKVKDGGDQYADVYADCNP